jgi:hypothetical protein
LTPPDFDHDHEFTLELEAMLGGQTAGGAPAELRPRILRQIRSELGARRRERWEARALWAAAALLLAAVAANFCLMSADERSLARYFGEEPRVPHQIEQWSHTIAAVTGPELTAKMQANLQTTLRFPARRQVQRGTEAVQRLLRELAVHEPTGGGGPG